MHSRNPIVISINVRIEELYFIMLIITRFQPQFRFQAASEEAIKVLESMPDPEL